MSGHTKGPWQVLTEECDKPYIRIRGTVLGGRYKIANVLTPVYGGVAAREAQETRANARLIAAAPSLLDALQGMVEWRDLIESLPSFPAKGTLLDDIDYSRAAIAKALGEPQ